jgi:hypothetical protein
MAARTHADTILGIIALALLSPAPGASQSVGDAAAAQARKRAPVEASKSATTEAAGEGHTVPTAPPSAKATQPSSITARSSSSRSGGSTSGGKVYTNQTLLETRDTALRGTFSGPRQVAGNHDAPGEAGTDSESESTSASTSTNTSTNTPRTSPTSTTSTASAPAPAPAPPSSPATTPQAPVGSGDTPKPGASNPPANGETPAIPELAKWKADMMTYGRRHCTAAFGSNLTSDQRLAHTYYDAVRVFYQIADYTGDSTWNACALKARAIYRDAYVLPNKGGVPGYWNFTTGLRMDWERTGDSLSKQAVTALATRAAFAADWTNVASLHDTSVSREVAYAILSYLNAEDVGEARRARLPIQAQESLSHIDQWFVSRTSRAPIPFSLVPAAAGQYYLQPFMVGLTTQALIRYAETTNDPRVLPAVKVALDQLWERAWVPANRSFWYQNWVADPRLTFPAQTGAPDLNLLIAPAFAWLYRQTGDITYRDRGDQVFAGGVKGAWLDGPKQFNQNYAWSFDYVKWRSEP